MPGSHCALRTASNIRHQTEYDQAMSDTSPPLHDPSVTPTSPPPDSFQCSWDFDQHCKNLGKCAKNHACTNQTNHIYKLLRTKNIKNK